MSLRDRVFRLFEEFRRRRVFRIAAVYAIVGYGVMEAANNFFGPLNLPPWTNTLVAVLLLCGFPVALVMAWLFDITPEGVKRSDPGAPVAPPPGARRYARAGGLLGAGMVIALVTFGGYSMVWPEGRSPARSLAVLPFENLGSDAEGEYLAAGMTEDVLGHVLALPGLRVVSRTSVMQYKRTRKSAPDIGRELGVDYVLESTLRRDRDLVRVAVRLVDTRTDEPVWSDSYDREMTRVLALQTDIARAIASGLDARLTRSQDRRLAAAAARQVNPDAYDAYVRGVHLADGGRHADAAESLERSIAIDPDYAPAHAALARSLFFLGFYGFAPPAETFARMRLAAQNAVDGDELLADAHATLALYYAHHDWNWGEAEAHFLTALELGPNNAQVHHDYAHFLLARGRVAESARESSLASALDPANSMLAACAGWHGFTNGEYDDAVHRSRQALMMMPDMFWPELVLGWAYERTGRTEDALVALRAALEHSNRSNLALASLGHAMAPGQPAEARRIAAEMEAARAHKYVSAYDLAVLHTALGDLDRGLHWLAEARTERAGFLVHAGWDPRLANLHDDPRFEAFLAGMGVPRQPLPAPRRGTAEPMPMAMPMAS
ncbi:MAG TPA: hypothetical protein VMN78_11545 [Longimicrobiales bacterium]|nr:hypothetical protein [Longimicrobiales bacterium]